MMVPPLNTNHLLVTSYHPNTIHLQHHPGTTLTATPTYIGSHGTVCGKIGLELHPFPHTHVNVDLKGCVVPHHGHHHQLTITGPMGVGDPTFMTSVGFDFGGTI